MTNSTDEFKANISAVFIVENTVRIFTYYLLGVFTLNSLKQTVILIPFMIIGFFVGMNL